MTGSKPARVLERTFFPQTGAAAREARRAIVELAMAHGFRGQLLDDIEIAVGEALANAIEHGCGKRGSFEIAVSCDVAGMTVEISDSGLGFDHQSERPHLRPPVESARGYGTFLMRELMDEVEYTRRGTHLRLLKRFPH